MSALSHYVTVKDAIIAWLAPDPINSDAVLHIHGGLAVLMAARVLTGRSLSTLVPLACVVAVQVANEIVDRLNHGSWRWPDTIGDTVNTLFWPTIIFVGLRLRDRLPVRRRSGDDASPM